MVNASQLTFKKLPQLCLYNTFFLFFDQNIFIPVFVRLLLTTKHFFFYIVETVEGLHLLEKKKLLLV